MQITIGWAWVFNLNQGQGTQSNGSQQGKTHHKTCLGVKKPNLMGLRVFVSMVRF
jgi:hypothetical protein